MHFAQVASSALLLSDYKTSEYMARPKAKSMESKQAIQGKGESDVYVSNKGTRVDSSVMVSQSPCSGLQDLRLHVTLEL